MRQFRAVDRKSVGRAQAQVNLLGCSVVVRQVLGLLHWIGARGQAAEPLRVCERIPAPSVAVELVRGGPEAVGRSTTAAVVKSTFLVIVADVVFTTIFYFTGGR